MKLWLCGRGEFGRTPFAQGNDGRDHNQYGFTIWMAGGGVKAGTVYGATDEWGYKAIENRTEIHDLHATMLHLLGVDHTQSTYRFGGRDMRLTDVKGHLIHDINLKRSIPHFLPQSITSCRISPCEITP